MDDVKRIFKNEESFERLFSSIIDAEIERLLDSSNDLKCNTSSNNEMEEERLQ